MLSTTAFEPHLLATTMDPDLLNPDEGTVLLDIAADGKSAKLTFVNATQSDKHPEVDATKAVSIDTGTPNRTRNLIQAGTAIWSKPV